MNLYPILLIILIILLVLSAILLANNSFIFANGVSKFDNKNTVGSTSKEHKTLGGMFDHNLFTTIVRLHDSISRRATQNIPLLIRYKIIGEPYDVMKQLLSLDIDTTSIDYRESLTEVIKMNMTELDDALGTPIVCSYLFANSFANTSHSGRFYAERIIYTEIVALKLVIANIDDMEAWKESLAEKIKKTIELSVSAPAARNTRVSMNPYKNTTTDISLLQDSIYTDNVRLKDLKKFMDSLGSTPAHGKTEREIELVSEHIGLKTKLLQEYSENEERISEAISKLQIEKDVRAHNKLKDNMGEFIKVKERLGVEIQKLLLTSAEDVAIDVSSMIEPIAKHYIHTISYIIRMDLAYLLYTNNKIGYFKSIYLLELFENTIKEEGMKKYTDEFYGALMDFILEDIDQRIPKIIHIIKSESIDMRKETLVKALITRIWGDSTTILSKITQIYNYTLYEKVSKSVETILPKCYSLYREVITKTRKLIDNNTNNLKEEYNSSMRKTFYISEDEDEGKGEGEGEGEALLRMDPSIDTEGSRTTGRVSLLDIGRGTSESAARSFSSSESTSIITSRPTLGFTRAISKIGYEPSSSSSAAYESEIGVASSRSPDKYQKSDIHLHPIFASISRLLLYKGMLVNFYEMLYDYTSHIDHSIMTEYSISPPILTVIATNISMILDNCEYEEISDSPRKYTPAYPISQSYPGTYKSKLSAEERIMAATKEMEDRYAAISASSGDTSTSDPLMQALKDLENKKEVAMTKAKSSKKESVHTSTYPEFDAEAPQTHSEYDYF